MGNRNAIRVVLMGAQQKQKQVHHEGHEDHEGGEDRGLKVRRSGSFFSPMSRGYLFSSENDDK